MPKQRFASRLLSVLQQAHFLSLEVALGAMGMYRLVARLAKQKPLPEAMACIGLAVMAVYWLDHLLDANRLTIPAKEARRWYFQRYRFPLSLAWVGVVLLGMGLALSLPRQLLTAGLLLGLGCALYLLLTNYLSLGQATLKQLSIALGYTGAMALCADKEFFTNPFVGIGLAAIFCVALANLLLFRWYEHEPRYLPKGAITWVSIAAMLALSLATANEPACALALLLVIAGQVTLLLFPGWMRHKERYRWVADGAFMLAWLV